MATAVLIFLASDGLAPGGHQKPTVTVYLIDTSGSNHSLGEPENFLSGVASGKPD